MPAKINILLTSVILSVAGLSGCASTGTTANPALTETAALAGTDAVYALALPETVSVLPQSSGRTVAADASYQVASLTPEAATDDAVLALAPPVKPGDALPALASAASVPATTQTEMPIVEQVAFVAPANPALDVPAIPSAGSSSEIDQLIAKYAAIYELPVDLVRHVVKRESTFNPRAYNNGHWGLMQIKHATARGMGYDGPAKGLFDAETNLKYAVKYLRGAYLVADGNPKRADWLYQTGYYYDAKRKGLLDETGLGRDRVRHRRVPDA